MLACQSTRPSHSSSMEVPFEVVGEVQTIFIIQIKPYSPLSISLSHKGAVGFSGLCMTYDDAIVLAANEMCAYTFLRFWDFLR